MPTYKLDDEGNYLPFPGYTVICKLNVEKSSDIWRNLFSDLMSNLKVTDYYSILPLSSWHVTAINLFTKRSIEEHGLAWNAYTASQQNFFNELIQALQQKPLMPSMKYSRLYMNGALQLEVVLDHQSADEILALAMRYRYEQKIPHRFHVTLGYQYKYLNHAQFEALKLDLIPLMQAYLNNLTLQLQPAQLCYFDDMTLFTSVDQTFLSSLSSNSIFTEKTHSYRI